MAWVNARALHNVPIKWIRIGRSSVGCLPEMALQPRKKTMAKYMTLHFVTCSNEASRIGVLLLDQGTAMVV